MSPWPGVEVEGGKRGGIKEVEYLAGEPLGQYFEAEKCQLMAHVQELV